jgi:L-malate glycosyltransferase
MKKILFFTSTSQKTGSETILYNLISNIENKNIVAVGLVSIFSGTLIENNLSIPVFSFESFLNKAYLHTITIIFYFFKNNVLLNIKALKNIKQYLLYAFIDKIYKQLKPDYFYINTITLTNILEFASINKIPCILHSHELEQMLIYLSDTDIDRLITYPKLIIACSQSAANLFNTLGRNKDILINYSGINTKNIEAVTREPMSIRHSLGVSGADFLWATSGSTDINKNPVKFVEIVYELTKKRGYAAHFVWLGCNLHSGLSVYCQRYANQLGVDGNITWLASIADESLYYSYLCAANAFLLTSTKESLSLVTLEALYLKKPIVSFNCGGISEIINDSVDGFIVNSWDVSNFVDKMILIMSNSLNHNTQSDHTFKEKFDIKNQIKNWNMILNDFFEKSV